MLNSHSNTDLGLLLIRVGVGIIFIAHGWNKLLDIAGTTGFFASYGIPAAPVFVWVVAIVELLAGIALVVGLWVSIAGLLLAIVMIMAITIVKIPTGGIGSIEYEFVLLLASLGLMFSGGGIHSLDSRRHTVQAPNISSM